MPMISTELWLAREMHKLRVRYALDALRSIAWRRFEQDDKPHIKRNVLKDKARALISHDHMLTRT